MVLQAAGSGVIALGRLSAFYGGLALFLVGSGLNVTCLNMMLTQRFSPEDPRREGAFLWNYAGMNIGVFVGFAVAGHYQSAERCAEFFVFATVGNVLSIVLCAATWAKLKDLDTPLLTVTPGQFRARLLGGLAILVGRVPVVWFLLQSPGEASTLLKAVCALVGVGLVVLMVRHPDARERRNMTAYLVLTVGSLAFWSLCQMAPSGLQLFADHHVDLVVAGVKVQPQWIQNINTVVIVVGGLLLSALFVRLRAQGFRVDVPQQFAASLLLMGLGFLALPVGISRADAQGLTAFGWLGFSYILQSVGERLISKVGCALVGQLAPRQHQGS